MSKFLFWLVICLCICTTGLIGAAQAEGPEAPTAGDFRAGAATSNITPFLGELIVGGFSPKPARHIHDELHARCLVLDDGRTRVAIVLCDNVGIVREVFDEAKRLIHERTGLATENMLMAATHTHSATSARGSSRFKVGQPLDEYQRFLARRIADGVVRAINNLEPARIGWGVGREPSQVFNRRWFMKPGTPIHNPFGGEDKVRMNPGTGDPNLLEPAGPTDSEISFISVQARVGRPLALLANYSLHYVGGTGPQEISADYFAMFADRIQQFLGADRQDPPFVGIMSNGTSGDINNINFRAPRERLPPYERMRQVADVVAAEVFRVYATIQHHDWVPLKMLQREITLQTRRPVAEQLEWAKMVLDRPQDAPLAHPREWAYAERVLEIHRFYPPQVPIILQALRVGEVGIAAIPAEVFVEMGLELKEKSPFRPTFTISLANGWYGYLPTVKHHELGGYETWLGTNVLEIPAAAKILDALLDLLNRLSGE